MIGDNPCSDCGAVGGAVGFHECPHQEILRRVAQTQLREEESREARDRDLDRLAREFWERTVLAAYLDPRYIPAFEGERSAAKTADALTAEWRKRFDPREGV